MRWDDGAAGRIEVDGLKLETLTLGPPPGDAPTLVLLHEGLGCVALWRNFPQALAAATGCGVFLWSRAGYGQSDPAPPPWPLDYMTREAETRLQPTLDAAGVRDCVLVGHSDGATIAVEYAGGVSDGRVLGLVLIAPHVFAEPTGLAAIARTRLAFAGKLRDGLAKYHRDPDGAFHGWSGAWLDPSFRDWNVEDAIRHIRVPVLAIQGRDDEYGALAQLDAIEAQCPAPVERLVLDDCRHAPHLERPAETVAAIQDFTARLLAPDWPPG